MPEEFDAKALVAALTPLGGLSNAHRISFWRSTGYLVKLIFLSLPSVDIALRRGDSMWRMLDDRLFTLEICIVSGPMTKKFVKRNRIIARTLKIRGDQTLEELHDAIFDAFGREDGHMYEFQIGGKGPSDPKSERYVLPMAMKVPIAGARSPAGDVTHASVGALGLKAGEAFGYWFDFGDDWRHQINVLAIEAKAPRGKYPRVTKRVGADPPQYADLEEAS